MANYPWPPQLTGIVEGSPKLCGDFWNDRIYKTTDYKVPRSTELKIKGLVEARTAIMYSAPASEPAALLIRGWNVTYEKLLLSNPVYKTEFENILGMTLEQYFAIAMYLLRDCESRIVDDNLEFGIMLDSRNYHQTSNLLSPSVQRYFQLEGKPIENIRERLLSGKTEELTVEEPLDLRALRDSPIIMFDERNAVISDPVILAEKTMVGPLFALSRQRRDVMAAFGFSFEAFLSKVLDSIAIWHEKRGERMHVLHQPRCFEKGRKEVELCDAAIVLPESKEVFLIEAKAKWLLDSILWERDPDRYIRHIREKYGVTEKERLGVGQLARSISKLTAGDWRTNGLDMTQVDKVYPMLVVFDDFLSDGNHAWFMSREFRVAMGLNPDESSQWCQSGRFAVAPLILLPVSALDSLEGACSAHNISKVIGNYLRQQRDEYFASFHTFIHVHYFLNGGPGEFSVVRNYPPMFEEIFAERKVDLSK